MSNHHLKLIIAGIVAVILLVGGAIYFNRFSPPQSAGNKAPIPMRILINTSVDGPIIDGEVFTLGEWRHVSEEWFQKNASTLQEYPEIKEARVILEEKLAGISEGEMKQVIEEQGLANFAQGLKDTSVLYNQPLPAIADTVLKIKPYEITK